MKQQPDLDSHSMVVVGRFGKPHGIKGWITIHSFTEPYDNLLDYQPWFIQEQGTKTWKALEYEKVEFHAKGIVVLLKGVTDRNMAALYTQSEVAVLKSQLPVLPENEHYWSDLEGLNVVTKEGVILGQVEHLFETGSNDVLVVKGERQRLIPYLMGNTILNVDPDNSVITVDWDPDF